MAGSSFKAAKMPPVTSVTGPRATWAPTKCSIAASGKARAFGARWEITIREHGGFYIWHRQAGEGEERAESATVTEPLDVIATQEIASGAI